jgi:hypothetical protein
VTEELYQLEVQGARIVCAEIILPNSLTPEGASSPVLLHVRFQAHTYVTSARGAMDEDAHGATAL